MTEDAFLERLLERAPDFGITRLADITGLDRIGLPVWQAIRPAGLALSVHQGKGTTPIAARIGALCEAMESHCAEQAPADGPLCPFVRLSDAERASQIGDYASDRDDSPSPDAAIQWCSAVDVITGRPHQLPHDLVSMDFTRSRASRFERSSDGLGAGPDLEHAIGTALREALERDAAGEWERSGSLKRMASCVSVASVPFAWFHEWRERLRSLDVSIRLFATEAVDGLPVIMCAIASVEEFRPNIRMFGGWCAHGDPEVALFKAFAEAVQSRLTEIAAARDDILPDEWIADPLAPAWIAVPPVPSGFPRRTWQDIEPLPSSWQDIAERLVDRGYPQIVMKRLDDGEIPVVKLFVPGLGSRSRTRREPLWQ